MCACVRKKRERKGEREKERKREIEKERKRERDCVKISALIALWAADTKFVKKSEPYKESLSVVH